MTKKLVLWDWNGCLLDDCEWVYTHGPVRIFRHFNVPVPSIETYRNEVERDFMNSFYWKYGIPRSASAEDLDTIMKHGYDAHGEPYLQDDALATLEAILMLGLTQVLVTGFDAEMLGNSLAHHGIADYFLETHGGARKKAPIFTDVLERARVMPEDVVGVSDTLGDVAALQEIGAQAFICPRGFHGLQKIEASREKYPGMVVIDDLISLLRYL